MLSVHTVCAGAVKTVPLLLLYFQSKLGLDKLDGEQLILLRIVFLAVNVGVLAVLYFYVFTIRGKQWLVLRKNMEMNYC